MAEADSSRSSGGAGDGGSGRSVDGRFLDGLARAFGGAIIFSLLVGLSHFSGFEATFEFRDDAVDALVAYAVGFATATVALAVSLYILWTFGRLEGLALAPLVETMVVLGLPAAIGAAAARLLV